MLQVLRAAVGQSRRFDALLATARSSKSSLGEVVWIVRQRYASVEDMFRYLERRNRLLDQEPSIGSYFVEGSSLSHRDSSL
jgi:hypothetical protein